MTPDDPTRSKRGLYAALALQGLLQNVGWSYLEDHPHCDPITNKKCRAATNQNMVRCAIQLADELIQQLEQE